MLQFNAFMYFINTVTVIHNFHSQKCHVPINPLLNRIYNSSFATLIYTDIYTVNFRYNQVGYTISPVITKSSIGSEVPSNSIIKTSFITIWIYGYNEIPLVTK